MSVSKKPITSKRIRPPTTPEQAQTQIKKPWLAAVLSIIPGLGHIYIGKTIKGIVLLVIWIAIDLIGFAPLLIALYVIGVVYDAYATAKKINRGEIKV